MNDIIDTRARAGDANHIELARTPAQAAGHERTAPSIRVWRALTLGGHLGRRAAIVLWLSALIGIALFAGWNWVVAAGLASLVLSVLPCAAMCALGLCAGSQRNCADRGGGNETPPPKS